VTGALRSADTREYGLMGAYEVVEFSLPGRYLPPILCLAVIDVAGFDTPLLSIIDRVDEQVPILQGGDIEQVGIMH
jgi:hypothetical protein